MRNRRDAVSVLVTAACLACVAGCTTTGARSSSIHAIRWDPSPEVLTLTERPTDTANRLTVVRNENWRMFWDDLGRAFYLDRPSRLSPDPMPH